jgi:hypothetical protein
VSDENRIGRVIHGLKTRNRLFVHCEDVAVNRVKAEMRPYDAQLKILPTDYKAAANFQTGDLITYSNMNDARRA